MLADTPVKNWGILLEQRFTADMPFLFKASPVELEDFVRAKFLLFTYRYWWRLAYWIGEKTLEFYSATRPAPSLYRQCRALTLIMVVITRCATEATD